ncbi:hypothetical protein F442_07385 [Phytophthora nicotianae P10297]|uniref:Uncharacterized protein n=1 Tax=Phytophthora nicotianae P10297 TaxID=1317064 RepID=W2ZGC7_PHYNI|nr:hypothetical protein F442_07385 [Phytophthora nicotianae P10297]
MAFQITSILTLLVLCLAVVAADFVHFFVDTNFRTSSGHWIYNFSKSQFCINMGVFDDKVSSAQWRDLPQNGSFADNHALVAFYSGGNCTGTVRTWPTVEKTSQRISRSTESTSKYRPSWSGRQATRSRKSLPTQGF